MKDQPRFIIHSDNTIEQIIEPCEDCISRADVRRILNHEVKIFNVNTWKALYEKIDDLPSVQPISSNEKEIYNKGWKDGAKAAAYHYELCIEEIKADIAEFMSEIPTLGNCKEGWHNAGQRIGLEQACEIIDNHIADMRKPERICDSCKYKGKSATIEMTTITRCHNPNVGVHEDDKRCEFYERGTE